MPSRPDNAVHKVRDRGDTLFVSSRLRLPLGKFYVFLIGVLLCLNFVFLPQARNAGWNVSTSLGVLACFDLAVVLVFTLWLRGFTVMVYIFDRAGFTFRLGYHKHRFRYDSERSPYLGIAVDPGDPDDVPEPAVFLPCIEEPGTPDNDEDEDDDEPHELVCADEDEARWLLGEIENFRARFV